LCVEAATLRNEKPIHFINESLIRLRQHRTLLNQGQRIYLKGRSYCTFPVLVLENVSKAEKKLYKETTSCVFLQLM